MGRQEGQLVRCARASMGTHAPRIGGPAHGQVCGPKTRALAHAMPVWRTLLMMTYWKQPWYENPKSANVAARLGSIAVLCST